MRQRGGAIDPRRDVVNRLLLAERALEATPPDEGRVASLVYNALSDLPGVGDLHVCIPGAHIPPAHRFESAHRRCDAAWADPMSLDVVAIEQDTGTRCIPLRNASHLFGLLLIVVTDTHLLSPYEVVLARLAETATTVLEQRLTRTDLADANTQLRRDHEHLEIRVAEQTRELEFLSTHDRLTGLPNRSLLAARVQESVTRARRDGSKVAVAYLRPDALAFVDGRLGAPIGDDVLIRTAQRLAGMVNDEGTVARVSSGEFVIVLTGRSDIEAITHALDDLMAAVVEPARVSGRSVEVVVDVGCSVYPEDGDDAELLLRRARITMERAKEADRGTVRFFAAGADAILAARAELEIDLRDAVAGNELLLLYQPQIDLRSGLSVGVEALMRWRHPTKGIVSPATFIPIAEGCGLITDLGTWALWEGCRQARRWQEAGLEGASVSVNLSAHQFRQTDLVSTVGEVLRATGLEPSLLELEITESALMHDIDEVVAMLGALKSLGVSLSIDDFGTGYSSLNHLRRFPIDKLKVDGSFIQDIETSDSAAAVVRAVIGLGAVLGLTVIAEGVETDRQAALLRGMDCHGIQGYLVTRPAPADEIEALLNGSPVLTGGSRPPTPLF